MSTTKTAIQWTGRTWSPIRGCSRVSPGCDNCYAMKYGYRFKGPGLAYEGFVTLRKGKPDWTGKVSMLSPKDLGAPLGWREPTKIFISMSDPFHRALSNEEIAAMFGIAAACPRHTFQFLTKRADRLPEWFHWLAGNAFDPAGWCRELAAKRGATRAAPSPHKAGGDWPLPNVWLGVSCEDQERADERIPHLLQTPAAVRFVSAEPLLGPLDLSRYMPAWRCYDCRAFMLGRGDAGCDPDEGEADPCCSKCGSLRVSHVGLDWVIPGGESGAGARSSRLTWHLSLIEQCRAAGVAVFEKQLGAKPLARWPADDGTGDLFVPLRLKNRKGGDMGEWPASFRVREFPGVRP